MWLLEKIYVLLIVWELYLKKIAAAALRSVLLQGSWEAQMKWYAYNTSCSSWYIARTQILTFCFVLFRGGRTKAIIDCELPVMFWNCQI